MSDPTIPPSDPTPTPSPTPTPTPPVAPTIGYASPSTGVVELPPGYIEPDPAQRSLAMVGYILNIFMWLGPLILYLVKKDDPTTGPYVRREVKKALNWGITMQIGIIIGIVTTPLFCIGAILNLALIITNIVFVILNAMKANKGEPGSHPFAFPFVK